MILIDLPADILWCIWDLLKPTAGDCNHFVQTSHSLYDTFNNDLYHHFLHRHKRYSKILLLEAARICNEDCVRSLLSHGANPRINEDSIIDENCGEDEPSFDYISKRRILEESQSWQLSTPLCRAIARGQTAVVKVLLDAGANVNAHTLFGGLPILTAIQYNRPNAIRLLIDAGAVLNVKVEQWHSLLGLAATGSDNGGMVVAALLAPCAPGISNPFGPETKGFEDAFLVALRCGEIETITPFLDILDDMNRPLFSGKTPLEHAIVYVSRDTVKYIYERGGVLEPHHLADFDSPGLLGTAISLACPYSVRFLLKRGVQIDEADEEGRKPLWNAVYACGSDTEILRLVLEQKPDTEIRNKEGDTPLLHAIHHERLDMVDLLLSAGADTSARDARGHIPLTLATEMSWPPAARRLLLAGADAAALGAHGHSVLFFAIQKGEEGMMKVLLGADLEAGARSTLPSKIAANARFIDTPDALGRTPLFLATLYGFASIVQLLLSNGSDAITTATNSGRTALSFAQDIVDQAAEIKDPSIDQIQETDSKSSLTDTRPGAMRIANAARYGHRGMIGGVYVRTASIANPPAIE
ncbi:ankyrin repeat-containing domain protein [Aspergillus heterothallicus]